MPKKYTPSPLAQGLSRGRSFARTGVRKDARTTDIELPPDRPVKRDTQPRSMRENVQLRRRLSTMGGRR